ncbi:MAG: hypothetical protein KJ970_06890 [Candidatus Eisenbacteria bacterium]|uniref:Uncharacterized protein n=1 Tax=Eiseniibacteriota bacterium TaxID=2212470 RepID=A0A948W620_UNCEI|nr:hypothetical protein [Candidatus Eisenbacteria bacterium]MBU2690640.1 hypothetical protein [Candidatus Eisenbacteria bacterium]
MNCWELKKCGREPGGFQVDDLGVCPAAAAAWEPSSDKGDRSRHCWDIAGTLSGGIVEGSFAVKLMNCAVCDVFLTIQQVERLKPLPK